jgi:hypothetical protein
VNRRALAVFGGAGAVLLWVALTTAGAVPDPTHTTGFCIDCHTDISAAHAGGPHHEVRCAECHTEPGLSGEAAARWHGLRHLRLGTLHDSRSAHHPPHVRVTRAACVRCHDPAALSKEIDDWRGTKLGLRSNHGAHDTAAREQCVKCHGPAQRPRSDDPLDCIACHQMTGHHRERTARSRSFGLEPAIPTPAVPTPPPPPVDPDEEEDEFEEEEEEPMRCTPEGIQRCGGCHNGRSHGNGTKPPQLPNILEADDPFTCRRCHHKGRNF